MAQPAEAEQACRPFLGRRRDLERRAAVADHDLAGKGEAAGIDFARAGAVGGAQVLRRDQQAVGPAGNEAQADERMATHAAGDAAKRAPRQEQRQLGPLPDRQAGHGYARLSNLRAPDAPTYPVPHIAKAETTANRLSPVVSRDSGRVEAIEPAHPGFGIIGPVT